MNIVLTGGGSAGHIIPNLALVKELKKHFDNIYYIGSNKENEKKLVEQYGIEYFAITPPKLIRKFTLKNLTIPFKLIKSINECKKLLKSLNVDVIFSKGGYISLPVVMAGHKLGIKVLIHESDTSLGLANKICSRYCDKIFTTFPIYSKSNKIIQTGTPIREEFLNPPHKQNFFKNNKKTILVVGGSQGSKTINEFIYQNIDELTKNYNIIHLCGINKLKQIKNDSYLQIEFSNEMPLLINSSDIVLTRGGSNALFEILAIGKPMIIVPLTKKESRGEQIENAKFFTQHNLGCYMPILEINSFINLVEKQLNKTNQIQTLKNKNTYLQGNENVVKEILQLCKAN